MTLAPAEAEAERQPAWLLVLYDEGCAVCRRCRLWLEHQETHVPIRFLAAQSSSARHLAPWLPWLGAELVVLDDAGDAWIGPAAFLVCLWATVRYRQWSSRLSGPALAPMAERFFHLISTNRRRLAALVREPACEAGTCRHREVGVS